MSHVGHRCGIHAAVLLAVISRIQENKEVPEIEQRASAGAALGYVVRPHQSLPPIENTMAVA